MGKNRVKKIGMLAAVVLLAAGTLSGCKKVTAVGILKEAAENAQKASSYSGNMTMDMTMGIKQSGVSMDMDMGMDVDIEATNDPGEYHMNGIVSLSLMNMEMEMDTYLKESEDGKNQITYTNVNGEWTKLTKEKDDEALKDMMDLEAFVGKDSKLTIAKKTEKVNGKEAFIVTAAVTGEQMEAAQEMLGDLFEESMSGLDLSKMRAEVTIKIYKEDRLPASIAMEITEGLEEGSSEEADGTEITVEKMKFTMNFDEYNKVKDIKLPKEAEDAKESGEGANILGGLEEDNEDGSSEAQTDSDGNRIISDYGNKKSVTIVTPEGAEESEFADAYSASYILSGAGTYYAGIYYNLEELNAYWTEEDIMQSFRDNTAYYEETEEYTEVTFNEPKTVSAGGGTVTYASYSYCYSESFYEKEWLAYLVTEDGFAVKCDISESDSTLPDKITEADIVKLMGSIKE